MQLLRLEGFQEPWEVSIFKGRYLVDPTKSLQEYGIQDGDMIISVRKELYADGWKLKDHLDDVTSSDSDVEFEMYQHIESDHTGNFQKIRPREF